MQGTSTLDDHLQIYCNLKSHPSMGHCVDPKLQDTSHTLNRKTRIFCCLNLDARAYLTSSHPCLASCTEKKRPEFGVDLRGALVNLLLVEFTWKRCTPRTRKDMDMFQANV